MFVVFGKFFIRAFTGKGSLVSRRHMLICFRFIKIAFEIVTRGFLRLQKLSSV